MMRRKSRTRKRAITLGVAGMGPAFSRLSGLGNAAMHRVALAISPRRHRTTRIPIDEAGRMVLKPARDLSSHQVGVRILPPVERIAGAAPHGPEDAPASDALPLTRARAGAPQPGPHWYQGRAVMVTGAGGSIGSEIVRQLLALKPDRLVLVDAGEFALHTLLSRVGSLAEAAGVRLVPALASAGDAAAMTRLMRVNGVSVVLHAAAYKHVPLVEANPIAGLSNNLLATARLATAAARAGVGRFVLVSTDKAVRPAGLMGASKRLAEHAVQGVAARHGAMEVGIVRFGNVLGSSGSVVPLFREQVRRGGPVTVTDPRMKRYFMTVDEAAQLVLEAGALARSGEVLALDMGAPVAILDLARQVIASEGCRPRDAADPEGEIEISFIGARPGEKLRESLALSPFRIPTRHPRIFSYAEPMLGAALTARMLAELATVCAEGDEGAAVASAFRWLAIGDNVRSVKPRQCEGLDGAGALRSRDPAVSAAVAAE